MASAAVTEAAAYNYARTNYVLLIPFTTYWFRSLGVGEEGWRPCISRQYARRPGILSCCSLHEVFKCKVRPHKGDLHQLLHVGAHLYQGATQIVSSFFVKRLLVSSLQKCICLPTGAFRYRHKLACFYYYRKYPIEFQTQSKCTRSKRFQTLMYLKTHSKICMHSIARFRTSRMT